MHPQPETYWGHVNPIGPRGVYDEAKRYAEALTMAYHRQQGVNTAIVRIFNTYGPRMRPHDGRAIPTFMRQALQDKPLTVFGDGARRGASATSTTSIRGLYLLAASGEHLPVNLGNPQEFTILEFAETVIRVTGSTSEIVHEALPVDDPQVRQPDITRAKQLLGWEPEIELEEGLRRMLPTLGGAGRCVGSRARPLVAARSWLRGVASSRATARSASRAMLVGIFDDAQSIHGIPDCAFPQLKTRSRGAAREPLLGRAARRGAAPAR